MRRVGAQPVFGISDWAVAEGLPAFHRKDALPRAVLWCLCPLGSEQSDDPASFTPVGLQEFEHAVIARSWFAGQGPRNGVLQVEVPDRDGVGVSEGVAEGCADRPRPDARNVCEECGRLLRKGVIEREEAVGVFCELRQGIGAASIDTEWMQSPRRLDAQDFRTWWQQERIWPRCGFSVLLTKSSP
ncbi:MAG: hypothetical protein RL219_1485 [Actinomycetota bacterium]